MTLKRFDRLKVKGIIGRKTEDKGVNYERGTTYKG
ncbi:hypothetical protein ES705_36968 [subsurface metagenome]